MKLSKFLLQAILAGVTAGATSSCGDLIDTSDLPHKHTEACKEVCTEIQKKQKPEFDCPGCGMG